MNDARLITLEIILIIIGGSLMRTAWLNSARRADVERSGFFLLGLTTFTMGILGLWLAWIFVGL